MKTEYGEEGIENSSDQSRCDEEYVERTPTGSIVDVEKDDSDEREEVANQGENENMCVLLCGFHSIVDNMDKIDTDEYLDQEE